MRVKGPGDQLWAQRFREHAILYMELENLQKTVDELFPEQIQFQLPRPHALAGSVLQHCTNLLERLIQCHYPLIFKIGVTHCPVWRWGSKLYGYSTCPEKWSRMIVMHLAEESHSIGMLEAALIDNYASNLSLIILTIFPMYGCSYIILLCLYLDENCCGFNGHDVPKKQIFGWD